MDSFADQVNEHVATFIRQARSDAGMTQAELAAALGVAPSAVSNWERGDRVVSIAQLVRVARYTSCDITRLFVDSQKIGL